MCVLRPPLVARHSPGQVARAGQAKGGPGVGGSSTHTSSRLRQAVGAARLRQGQCQRRIAASGSDLPVSSTYAWGQTPRRRAKDETGFEPVTCGLWAHHATIALLISFDRLVSFLCCGSCCIYTCIKIQFAAKLTGGLPERPATANELEFGSQNCRAKRQTPATHARALGIGCARCARRSQLGSAGARAAHASRRGRAALHCLLARLGGGERQGTGSMACGSSRRWRLRAAAGHVPDRA